MIRANDPSIKSWVTISTDSDFSIQNLPFGIFSTKDLNRQVGIALGEYVICMEALLSLGYLSSLNLPKGIFSKETLNPFIKLGKQKTREVRNVISALFSTQNNTLQKHTEQHDKVLIPMSEVELHLPIHIGDYTDFYSSKDHATNVGTMFRDPENALLPNWKHLPVAYHGRASSIIPSGQEIIRPKGQQKPHQDKPPVFGASKLLDFELEMAFITHEGKPLGEAISTEEAEDYIFGMAIFNDWSARDIQKWEYIPLGPFLAKNFASSISPWIVTLDALEPFRVEGEKQVPEVLPYLQFEGNKNIDITLEVFIKPEQGKENSICTSNYKHMYWNMNQQLAHHTVNGCNVRAGDLMASGTISGPTPESYGSMLELSWKGTRPIKLSDGTERKFIQDGDTVIMRGYAQKQGIRIGFGEVSTKVLPAKP